MAHLHARRAGAPRRTISPRRVCNHLALNAVDRRQVDRVHEVLVALGADVLDAPAEYDYDPGYYAVFFRDPDGFKLEVVRLP